jgi:hypothetical protein
MASLDDILTTQKNGVQAINSYVNATNTHSGTNIAREISTLQTIKTSSGWLAAVSVLTTGTGGPAFICDTNATTGTTGTRIYAIPNTVGIYQVQLPFSTGLTFYPNGVTGLVVAIGYT